MSQKRPASLPISLTKISRYYRFLWYILLRLRKDRYVFSTQKFIFPRRIPDLAQVQWQKPVWGRVRNKTKTSVSRPKTLSWLAGRVGWDDRCYSYPAYVISSKGFSSYTLVAFFRGIKPDRKMEVREKSMQISLVSGIKPISILLILRSHKQQLVEPKYYFVRKMWNFHLNLWVNLTHRLTESKMNEVAFYSSALCRI